MIQYPILTYIFDPTEEISLDNPKVKEWTSRALAEIVKLHNNVGSELIFSAANGPNTGLLPIPCSNNYKSFMVNQYKSQWIDRAVRMSISNEMSLLDRMGCIRRRLAELEMKSVSESESLSDSDNNENDDANAGSK